MQFIISKLKILFIIVSILHSYELYGQITTADKYFNDGVLLIKDKKYSEADSLFALSINITPKADAYFNRGLANYKLNNFEKSCAYLSIADSMGDNNARKLYKIDCTSIDTVYYDESNKVVDSINSTSFFISVKSTYINKYVNSLYKKNKLALSYFVLDSDTVYWGGSDIQMPSFPGGEQELLNFLSHNTHYPKDALENGITGRVYISFTIDEDGNVTKTKILKGFKELNDEALRVVGSMPKWKSGSYLNKKIKVQYNVPINFNMK
jgi:TonB family protein